MTVVMRRAGNLLEVQGAVVGGEPLFDLDPFLGYWHRITFHGQDLRIRRKYKEQHPELRINPAMEVKHRKLYEIKGDAIYCAAGLKSRWVQQLQLAKVPFEYQDLRSKKLPPADFSRLQQLQPFEFRHRQDEVLAMVDVAEGGIIGAPPGYGKTFIALLLCLVYPESRIFFLSCGKSLLRDTYSRLTKYNIDVGRVGDGKLEIHNRVLLVSADSLHRVDLGKADLIIGDEVHEFGTTNRSAELARHFTEARWIGFSASFPGRTDGADPVVESLFGPVLMNITYQEAEAHGAVAPIVVLRPAVMATRSSPSSSGLDGAMRLSRVYWRNDQRNKTFAAQISMLPKLMGDPNLQILVMVDRLEHAYALREYLPDFQIVYGTRSEKLRKRMEKQELLQTGDEDELSSEQMNTFREDFVSGKLRRVISTFVWKQGIDIVNLSALGRADGNRSRIPNIQIPGRLSRPKDFAVLVDPDDQFDDWAHSRSLAREADYRRNGWKVINTPIPIDVWPQPPV